jgi:thiamine pyrophosphokinase
LKLNETNSVLRNYFLATFRITVDGGTNRWLSWLQKYNLEDKLRQPNLITGDLDSCHKESIAFFNKSRVIQTVDQDETDFTKSLRVLEPFMSEMNLENVIAMCETSGRLDQILGNINTLFKIHLKPAEMSRPVFILSANSLSWLLGAGDHQIHIPNNVKKLWCALVPLEATRVTTGGLKWNLTNQIMEFGGIVSTSNKYDGVSDVVTVTTDKALLWSMGISKIDDD